MKEAPRSVRLDKWLWAARFYKTRGLAQEAIAGGKIRLNGERPKPAKDVRIGDRLVVHIGIYEWVLTVKAVAERRGSAEIARTLYTEDADGQKLRLARMAEVRAQPAPLPAEKGRPTKRDRRRWEKTAQDFD
jgi:ribosome-associated heat shock protein Hsp15